MKWLFPMIIMLTLSVDLLAQELVPYLVIPGPIDRFTTDEIGNCYVLRGDEITLYTIDGNLLARNSVKTLGTITVIDAFYSLRPLLYSREQQQMASLDNTLSLQSQVINLPTNGWPRITLICASVQNAFWFYDQQEMSFTRVDRQLRTIASTDRVDQLLGWVPEPKQMQEFDGWLFVNDPAHGILVLDLFANYYKTIPIKEIEHFEVREGEVLFFTKGKLMRYDMLTFNSTEIALPLADATNARIERARVYVQNKTGLHVYRVDNKSGEGKQ